MNYAYIFVDNLNGHSYENGLNELKASIESLKITQEYESIQVFNNEVEGKNIEYFKENNIIHNHFNLSRNYGGSDNTNPISILVEKIIQLINFDEDQEIVLMDIDTSSQKKIPKDFFNQNTIVFDTVEYPIMQWRNLDKVLPQIPWKQFDINFDSSFMMYNTGVIYIPKKFRKELCEKSLKIVDYLNDNFDPSERCGNKLDEQIALSIVCHDVFGKYGNIKFSSEFIHHHWDDRQNGIEWWKNINQNNDQKISVVQVGTNHAYDELSDYLTKTYDNKDIDLLLLIEPNRFHNPTIKKCYEKYDNVIIENIAIKPSNLPENKTKIYYRDFIGGNFEVASCSFEHVLYHDYVQGDINSFEVSCLSLEELLDKHSITSLDWLLLDIEGIDAQVILNFSWEKYDIKRVDFEHLHLKENKELIKQKFLDMGYHQIDSLHDFDWAFTK